jgi:hypothetical protein
MRSILAAFALALGLLAVPARAEEPAAPKTVYGALEQVPLTEEQIKNYIEAQADMQTAMGDAPTDAAEPDAKTMAKLEGIAKKHGFRDFNEYNTVAGNVTMVLDGIDPDTKTYVGADKLIQRSIDEVNADKQMTADEKRAAISDLQTQLKGVTPVKNKGNIDLVVKNYDKLSGD